MNNLIVWISLSVVSIFFGILHYKAKYYQDIDKHNSYFKFLEFWRSSINYFITLVIVYYFISIRWPHVSQGNNLSIEDFTLGIFFLIGVFGWLPYFIKNITEGINAIIAKVLK